MDISFLNSILLPVYDFINGLLGSFLGFSNEQIVGTLGLLNLLLLWMKGKAILEFIRTYWNVLGVLLIAVVIATVLGWV